MEVASLGDGLKNDEACLTNLSVKKILCKRKKAHFVTYEMHTCDVMLAV